MGRRSGASSVPPARPGRRAVALRRSPVRRRGLRSCRAAGARRSTSALPVRAAARRRSTRPRRPASRPRGGDSGQGCAAGPGSGRSSSDGRSIWSVSPQAPFSSSPPSTQRHRAGAQLRGALGVGGAEEVPDAVGLVFGHQRRPLAGELLADPLELAQLPVGGEADVVVGERVGPEDARQDQRQDGRAEHLLDPQREGGGAAEREEEDDGAAGGERLGADPGRGVDEDGERSRRRRRPRRAAAARRAARQASQAPARAAAIARAIRNGGQGHIVGVERGSRRRARCRRTGRR